MAACKYFLKSLISHKKIQSNLALQYNSVNTLYPVILILAKVSGIKLQHERATQADISNNL